MQNLSVSMCAVEDDESKEAKELRELKESLEGTLPVGPLVAGAKTLDQVRDPLSWKYTAHAITSHAPRCHPLLENMS